MDPSTRLQQYETLLRQNDEALYTSLNNLFLDKVILNQKQVSALVYDLKYALYCIFERWNSDINKIVAAFEDINGTATIDSDIPKKKRGRPKKVEIPF
jgi:hypothetical protein